MKILLNCLPPADINTPSISLSILQKFMQENEVEAEIKYWNFLLSLMSDYTDSEDPEKRILPFLSILNDKENYKIGNDRILDIFENLQPNKTNESTNVFSKLLQKQKTEIYSLIHKELAAIDFSEIALMGISAKYYQWIPGIIIAEEIKKQNPKTKIIVGGFGSLDAAYEAIGLCPDFDFVTWGEGEYPLLELYNQLDSNEHDFDSVPRLLFREGVEIKQSKTTKSEYLDFNNYPFPSFDDYMDSYPFSDSEENEDMNFPINTIRSCHWRKCKFCDFNTGYKLRVRTPQCIIDEIECITDEYGITTFSFVDSDTFGNPEHFEELLDLIIDLKFRNEEDYIFWAEIIPNSEISSTIMKKMAIAGFKNLFIGYDGLSDSFLTKMNKRNTFSDNIFFVKESLKYSITPIVNVIRFIPDESKQDIEECKQNLHYLRFFYNHSVVKFEHNYVDLVLSSMTKYYSLLSQKEKVNYDKDDLTFLMPMRFSEGENRFHLFRFKHNSPPNIVEWEQLEEAEKYYKENRFSYTLLENDGVYYYTEFCNDIEIENIIFGEPEYPQVLKFIQEKVCSFEVLFKMMQSEFPDILVFRLQEILTNLKESYLVYFDSDFNGIVGVIQCVS
jgi:radical SAM superfamily enzyme YgiQ (UPF0313 family)